jgi:hypothetical protein
VIASAANLNKAVASARADLALRQERIVALSEELTALRKEHETAEKAAADESEVDKKVQGILSKLLSGEARRGLGAPAENPAEKQAAKRRVRIEAIATELDGLEVEEEQLLRSLEQAGPYMLPRRAGADVTLVVAPDAELEAALAESTSPRVLSAKG